LIAPCTFRSKFTDFTKKFAGDTARAVSLSAQARVAWGLPNSGGVQAIFHGNIYWDIYIYIYYICNVYVYPTMMGNIEGI
jgi:hypothetical protein